jgi:hypothetical protein
VSATRCTSRNAGVRNRRRRNQCASTPRVVLDRGSVKCQLSLRFCYSAVKGRWCSVPSRARR